jgi:hypothetical protein
MTHVAYLVTVMVAAIATSHSIRPPVRMASIHSAMIIALAMPLITILALVVALPLIAALALVCNAALVITTPLLGWAGLAGRALIGPALIVGSLILRTLVSGGRRWRALLPILPTVLLRRRIGYRDCEAHKAHCAHDKIFHFVDPVPIRLRLNAQGPVRMHVGSRRAPGRPNSVLAQERSPEVIAERPC